MTSELDDALYDLCACLGKPFSVGETSDAEAVRRAIELLKTDTDTPVRLLRDIVTAGSCDRIAAVDRGKAWLRENDLLEDVLSVDMQEKQP